MGMLSLDSVNQLSQIRFQSLPPIDSSWTLFLDRDGTINKRLEGDYVRKPDQFEWLPGVLEALAGLSQLFGRIIVVTNQQGIGKGLMTESDLAEVHGYMLTHVEHAGGRIDAIYHCPALAESGDPCRKPATGMAMQAKKDFPEIDFERSVMVGDGQTDMEFGAKLGMYTLHIQDHSYPEIDGVLANLQVSGLLEFWHLCQPILKQSK